MEGDQKTFIYFFLIYIYIIIDIRTIHVPDDPQISASISSPSSSNVTQINASIETSTLVVSEHFRQPFDLPRSQARITDFIQQSRPLTTTKKKQYDDQLTKMIVKG